MQFLNSMSKTKLKTIFTIVLFTYFQSYAQTLSNSPYSRYGIGDIFDCNNAQSEAMGGLNQSLCYSAWINSNNPASYSSIELSTFQTGIKLSQTQQSSKLDTKNLRNGNLTSIQLGIPVKKKWAISFGLLPYSGVGYNLSNTGYTTTGEEVNYIYSGFGGINRVYLGTGISPFGKSDSSWLKGFSVGANVSYLFGNIDYERRALFVNGTSNQFYNLREVNLYQINGVYLDFGAQYKTQLSKKWSLTTGATYVPSMQVKGKHSGLAQTYYLLNGLEYAKDTVNSFNDISSGLDLPSSFGIGMSTNYSDRLSFGFDYKSQNWSRFKLFDTKNNLSNSSSIAIGAQYIPNPSNGRGFWQHVQYRAGVSYSESYLKIKDTPINEKSISLGAGFPIIKSLSTLNIALKYGTRGTLSNNLLQEQFYSVSLGLTFSDKWFIQRKFD